MQIIDIKNLYEKDYHLTDITPHYHFWNTSGRWSTPPEGRTASGFMYLLGCEAFYYRNNKLILHAVPGEIIYLPKGATYQCVFSRVDGEKEAKRKGENFFVDGKNKSVIKNYNAINIRFNMFTSSGDFVFSTELFKIKNFKNAFSHFNALASMALDANAFSTKLKIRLYQLLSELSLHTLNHSNSKKYEPVINIINSIEQLDLNAISVQALTSISGLSSSRFRALFTEYTGLAPIKYIERLKADRAYTLLKSGELSVTEVSYAIGIDDPAYFARFYKKITGRKPTDDLLS